MLKKKFTFMAFGISIALSLFVLFLFQVNMDDLVDFVDHHGHNISPKTDRNYVSTRTVLRDLATEFIKLREKTSQDNMVMKSTLDRLISSNEDQSKLAEDIRKTVENEEKIFREQHVEIENQHKILDTVMSEIQNQNKKIDEQNSLINKQYEVIDSQKAQIEKLQFVLQTSIVVGRNEQLKIEGPHLRGFMKHGDPSFWKQRTFTHHGTFGFVPFSTYRVSMNKFATSALAALALRDSRKLDSCMWHASNGAEIQGELQLLYHSEHHYAKYETVVATCTLPSDTAKSGGYLVATIDNEHIILYNEQSLPDNIDGSLKYQSELTFCGPPMFYALEPRSIYEWVEYHRVVVGVDRFIFYDVGALNQEIIDLLDEHLKKGVLEITSTGGMPYDVYYSGQGLFMHDCLYRTQFTAKWIMIGDMDEYVQIMPPNTLPGLLEKYSDVPWLTHQAMWWGIEHCTDNSSTDAQSFAIERIQWRWPYPYCAAKDQFPDPNVCTGEKGHRKMILNPRKVELLAIHFIRIPDSGGVDLNVETELRHNHYQGLNTLGKKHKKLEFCKQTHKENEKVDWWFRDRSVAELVKLVKDCPVGDTSCTAFARSKSNESNI